MGTQTVSENDFNVLQFEKQLISLKDSQEAINNCCQWCLKNRVYHKKIVNSWLNILKRVKVEQRLILFYLANDVVQYSKRRNYEYVESWGTALQKATTMVRDEKVKHKILRIFKIWEQRSVYNEEFISDLCGLLSVVPSGSKGDEPHEFQPSYVVNKIKTCSKLEKDTDIKLKLLKEHNPKIQIDDGLTGSLKDRAHVDDVEKEVEVYIKHMEDYINALKSEIKNRITLISVLKQAETQLEADRKDVKLVANAYKMFGTRVKTFQRKLDEHKETLSSPIPSPDINAPSPSPDSDLDLPDDEEEEASEVTQQKEDLNADYNPKVELQYSAGYYNPAPQPNHDTSNNYLTNGFSSFAGSDLSFNLKNINTSVFNSSQLSENTEVIKGYTPPIVQNPPLPVDAPIITTVQSSNYSYSTTHLPLLPPPMPPFSKTETDYSTVGYTSSYTTSSTSFAESYTTTSPYQTTTSNYNTENPGTENTFHEESFEPPLGANPYPPSEEYNPEEDVTSWEQDAGWAVMPPDTDTPESPPMFEKEGYSDPVEYHDTLVSSGAVDVDHRVIPGITGELEDSMSSLGGKDVDHRNLISLTGSPGNSNSNNADQDYRIPPPGLPPVVDQDYRHGSYIDQLKLPPPPPPPPKFLDHSLPPPCPPAPENPIRSVPPFRPPPKSSRKNDNVESIDMDMDMSDEDVADNRRHSKQNDNLRVIIDHSEEQQFSLEPPPPLPDLPDDVDANNFLDDLSNDLHEFSNLSDDLSNSNQGMIAAGMMDASMMDAGMMDVAMMDPGMTESSLPDSGIPEQDLSNSGMPKPMTIEQGMPKPSMWSQPPLMPPPMMNFDDMAPPQMTPTLAAPPTAINTAVPPPTLNNMMSPPPTSLNNFNFNRPPGPLLPPPQPWLAETAPQLASKEFVNDDDNPWAKDDPIENFMGQRVNLLPQQLQQSNNWLGPPTNIEGPPINNYEKPLNDFDGPPPNNFEGPPPNNFEGPPPNNFEGPPPNNFEGPPPTNFEGPPNNFEGLSPNNYEGPPPNNYEGPTPNSFEGAPKYFEGPLTNNFGSPPANNFNGPTSNSFEGPPPSNFDGPPPLRNMFEDESDNYEESNNHLEDSSINLEESSVNFEGPPIAGFAGPPIRFERPPFEFRGPPNFPRPPNFGLMDFGRPPNFHEPPNFRGPSNFARPPNNLGFRGRGNNRGNFNNFNNRGRGRGGNFVRGGGNNFRGGRGGPRGNRGLRPPRGNFRGNFRGGF